MRHAASSDAADWIAPRLHRFALDVGSFVPDGFEAYARVSHRPQPSRRGSLSLQDVDRLVATLRGRTRTPDRCWFAIWEGWGDLTPFWRDAPSFSVPARKMHLLEGTIVDAFVNLGEIPWGYRSANLWWPDDRAWCVSSEIDFKWTFIGGATDCIAEIVSDPSLEAYAVAPTTLR